MMQVKLYTRLALNVVIGTAVLACTWGCGGKGTSIPTRADVGNTEAVYIEQLQERLAQELAERGIDADKAAAAAPSGADNAVFDLAAEVIDPDGEGPGLPTGIALAWTERLIGDYDQNSEVNGADITPLALYWHKTVNYDDPGLHGGFAHWPEGDPEGAGALSWRKSRVDGDFNGELNITDITPISQHWKEQLSGYRVMRKAPGEASFSVVEILGGPAGYTIEHPLPVAGQVVRYAFTDDEAAPAELGDGVYAYYVAAYDAQSGQAGPPSATVYVDLTTGEVNQGPTAALAITPGFGGAPAEITLDATGSYDLDGTIAAYEWDFDADGVVDWLSTESVPEQSSGGKVIEITPGSIPGVVTANYTQGYADWFYPSVAVIDDDDARSETAKAKLGISGWELELISAEDPAQDPEWGEVPFQVQKLVKADTQPEQMMVSGWTKYDWFSEEAADGAYIAWRQEDGSWISELAAPLDNPLWLELMNGLSITSISLQTWICWQDNSEPMLLIRAYNNDFWNSDGRVYLATGISAGNWELEEIFAGSLPEGVSKRGASVVAVESLGPGRFAACLADITGTAAVGKGGVIPTYHYYVLWYENGQIEIDDTTCEYNGPDTDTTLLRDFAVSLSERAVCTSAVPGSSAPAVRTCERIAQDDWLTQDWDIGFIGSMEVRAYPRQMVISPDDELFFLMEEYDSGLNIERTHLLANLENSPTAVLLQSTNWTTYNDLMWYSAAGISALGGNGFGQMPEGEMSSVYHYLVQGDTVVREELTQYDESLDEYDYPLASYVTEEGEAYAIVWCGNTKTDYDKQYFAVRVDPRM